MNELSRLRSIVKALRDPASGCPWFREQTPKTLTRYIIEEAYEVVNVLESGKGDLSKELGDLLLQIVIHSDIAEERGEFSLESVREKISKKMIRRNPHVFSSDGEAEHRANITIEEVHSAWQAIKVKEEGRDESSLLSDISPTAPALLAAQEISKKVAEVGYDWPSLIEVRGKLLEKIAEFSAECITPQPDIERIADEFGDLLFSLVQIPRKLGFDAESALRQANQKFVSRFQMMEQLSPTPLNELTYDELLNLWRNAKEALASK